MLRELLDYDPQTGILTWKSRDTSMFRDGMQTASHRAARWNSRLAGKEAFTASNSYGYRVGRIFNMGYLASRVIWAIHYGVWPVAGTDHINGKRDDNRIENPRDATQAQNMQNTAIPVTNTSGVMGVCWHAQRSKWAARIRANGKMKHLGLFANFDDAVACRKSAEAEFGYHANHGRAA